MPESELSEKIRKLRAQHGLTLEQVAQTVGVGRSTVRKWETGQIANMRRDKIAKLAAALHTTPGYLMGWESSPTSLGANFAAEDKTKRDSTEMVDMPSTVQILAGKTKASDQFLTEIYGVSAGPVVVENEEGLCDDTDIVKVGDDAVALSGTIEITGRAGTGKSNTVARMLQGESPAPGAADTGKEGGRIETNVVRHPFISYSHREPTKDNRLLYRRLIQAAEKDKKGALNYVHTVSRDGTDRVRWLSDMQFSALNAILDQMPDATEDP